MFALGCETLYCVCVDEQTFNACHYLLNSRGSNVASSRLLLAESTVAMTKAEQLASVSSCLLRFRFPRLTPRFIFIISFSLFITTPLPHPHPTPPNPNPDPGINQKETSGKSKSIYFLQLLLLRLGSQKWWKESHLSLVRPREDSPARS